MRLKERLPLMRLCGLCVVPILYIISFASTNWVISAGRQWGLWSWCYSNVTSDSNVQDFVNDTSKCHGISPGDSPGYFEAVRTIGSFSLVLCIGYLATFAENRRLGMGKTPCWVAFVALLGKLTTIAILAAGYKGDGRWKDQGPSLGWCFWMAVSSAIVGALMIWVFWKYDEMRKGASPVVARQPCTNLNPCPSRQGGTTTASVSVVLKRSNDPSRSPDGSARNGSPRVASAPAGEAWSSPAAPNAQRNSTGGGQFPVLSLPRYHVSPEPGAALSFVPPPSYEEAIMEAGRGGAVSPPPVYTVAEAGVKRQG